MLYMTIESLLRQTKKPNAIFLWLSKSLREQDIPAWLRRQARRGLTIRFCEDIGPHTKYYYAFKENPEDLIATCDDDRIYAPDWLEGLYETHRRDPKSIICYRAHQMLLDASGTFKKYHEWNFFSPGITDPSHFLFATGVGGILYPPGLLHEEVLNKELFLRLCPKADDIWLKAMAALNRIPHRKVKALFNDDSLPVVPGSQKTRLWDHNFGGGNDEQIKAVFNHFHLYDFFLEQSKCCRSFELKMNPRK
ncbi:MAG TPA: glycosyltransferase family A protein [Candidatus Omnitrophota bacterium]|nr:glycosyltransferase family A protein [Candidatus Omnitrophota bacterium]